VSTVSARNQQDSGSEAGGHAQGPQGAQGIAIGWTVFSYLIGGMAAYGGIGWLVGRAVGVALLFPIGMLVGLGIAVGYIIYRYGRP
jgi:F0F1-type ATP synthase assembly protein I